MEITKVRRSATGWLISTPAQCSHSGRSSTAGRKKMPYLQLARNVAAVR